MSLQHGPADRSQSTFKTQAGQAWRFSVTSDALAAVLILFVNIITLGVMYGKFDIGSCQTASTVTIVSYVSINVLSAIL